MATKLLFTFFLVLLNGFFVAAEFALVKVRGSQLDIKIQKGHSGAKLTKRMTEKLDAYLSATQLGITLASLGLGWIGESVFATLVRNIFLSLGFSDGSFPVKSISVPLAFAGLTFLHITLGEQIPKMIGIKYAMPVSLAVSWPLRIFYFVCAPFIWFLNKFSSLFLKMAGITKYGEEDIHTEEELRLLLTESEEGGAIKPSENELIQNVFDFDDRIVKQVMIPRNRVSAIDVELGREQITRFVLEEGFSRLPVYLGDVDNIIGIVHSKDLLKSIIENKYKSIKDIMRPAHFVPESMKINELLRDFQKYHLQMAIVTNEFGSTSGIVTMEDIIEELVGEIQDEHDEEKPIVERKSENEFLVNAQASIADVNEILPMAIPENPHYETVSGYVNYVFGRIPAVNDSREADGYRIKIVARNKQHVEKIQLNTIV